MKLDIHKAIATSLFATIFSAIAGVVIYWYRGDEEGTWFKRKKDDICFRKERFLLTEAESYFRLLMIMIIIIKLNLIINRLLK
jgi:Na+-driven multidrug efflux pump